jgi:hypothetical protein
MLFEKKLNYEWEKILEGERIWILKWWKMINLPQILLDKSIYMLP